MIAATFPLTPQAFFDHAAEHMMGMKSPCEKAQGDKPPQPMYRHNGCACPVGACVPDAWYNPQWDNGGTSGGEVIDDLAHRGLITQESALALRPLARDLQSAHDECDDWGSRRMDLRAIAQHYGLNEDVLNKATIA